MFRKLFILAGMAGVFWLTITTTQAASFKKDPHFGLATGVTQFSEPKSRTEAVALLPGNEFAVATDLPYPDPNPTHFHSDDAGFFAVGANWMEVGELCISGDSIFEEVRGMAEFDMAGASMVGSATVNFDVAQLSGLFGQPGPGDFSIELVTYNGNNTEEISDYNITSSSAVTSLGTATLTVGQSFNIDVTGAYNAAVSSAAVAFGIRLQPTSDPGCAAVVFGNATLGLATSPPRPVAPEVPIPVNTPLGLIALLLVILAAGFQTIRRRVWKG